MLPCAYPPRLRYRFPLAAVTMHAVERLAPQPAPAPESAGTCLRYLWNRRFVQSFSANGAGEKNTSGLLPFSPQRRHLLNESTTAGNNNLICIRVFKAEAKSSILPYLVFSNNTGNQTRFEGLHCRWPAGCSYTPYPLRYCAKAGTARAPEKVFLPKPWLARRDGCHLNTTTAPHTVRQAA